MESLTIPYPPIQEEIDRIVADLVDDHPRGSRKAIAAYMAKSAQLITRWLNPNDHEAPSPIASVLLLLFGAHQAAPELESELWALIVRERRRFRAQKDVDNSAIIQDLIKKSTMAHAAAHEILVAVSDGEICEKDKRLILNCLLRERAAGEQLEALLQ